MPYTLLKTNGTKLTTVQDGSVDVSTDLTFVGKNYTGYASPVNENFVKLLENFANTSAPKKPLTGQLWYDSAEKRLKVYDNKKFKSLSILDYGSQFPTGAISGELHFNQVTKKLSIYDGASWLTVGPYEFSSSGTGLSSSVITDSDTNNHLAYIFTLNNSTATIFSSDSPKYNIPVSSPLYGRFKAVYPGITLPNANSAGISISNTASVANGYVLWGTAASAMGLVRTVSTVTSLLTANDFVLRNEIENGYTRALDILSDDGITVGVQRAFRMHVTNSTIANLSALVGSRIQFNVNTGVGTFTNIVNVDASGTTYALLPNSLLPVNIGSSNTRFANVFANTASINNLVSSNIQGSIITVTTASASQVSSLQGTINNLQATTITAVSFISNTVSSTNITGTAINGVTVRGNEIYDSGSRVLTTSTIGQFSVQNVTGTVNQIAVSQPSTGVFNISLPSTVAVNSVTASVIRGTEIYDNGLRVLTSATIPSLGVTTVAGSANQILVNGLVGASSGSVTLSLASNLSVSAINQDGNRVFSVFSSGTTGITNVSGTPGQLTLGGVLSVGHGGSGAVSFSAGYLRANGTSAFTTVSTIPNTDITGLGSMSTQNSNSVNISGGSISGLSSLTVSNPSNLRTHISAAVSGNNADITQLSGLTTPLSLSQGGTGVAAASAAALIASLGAIGVTTSSFNQNGFIQLSNGLMLQWGIQGPNGSGTHTLFYPTSFTSTVFGIYTTEVSSQSASNKKAAVLSAGLSSASMNVLNDDTGSYPATITYYWLAIGI